jgi:hypothetical protein
MIVGLFVLPLVTVGMTEASTTQSPVDSSHAQLRVDHRVAVDAHPAGCNRVLSAERQPVQVSAPLVVGLHARPRQLLLDHELLHARLAEDLTHRPAGIGEGEQIGVLAEHPVFDQRVGGRIRRDIALHTVGYRAAR